jgi:SAM-dependent methyltransferase
MNRRRVTRGTGLLEGFLARMRAKAANALIPPAARSGRILDIGCGSFPQFLVSTAFTEKFGLDKLVRAELFDEADHIRLVRHDVEHDGPLPFDDGFFDVVTMLAVFEHIPPHALPMLLAETHRVLKPGGSFILTTPAGWADPILRTLARLRLVSGEEIEEHQDRYDLHVISGMLGAAGFASTSLRTGTFELGMNLWAAAVK